ncbi:hypothetical protein [Mycolicibacterium mageritense]|uniref:hypothetical protein n=1 Tax=Mycolicibacterium mageritense TaxID=53462 RepID=UPI0011D2EBF3|nr:hypothetical protein [Mycolicibacterium mageritense]TXI56044.1 MAG: hypothetical protein E6Q55_30155 [Mycolicibacterium mageritense]
MSVLTRVDDIERRTLREEGLDPDDPAVITVINSVCWELALLGDSHSDRRGGTRRQRGDARW